MTSNELWARNRYRAPRVRLMVAGLCLGGMADLAISGALPLRFSGTDGGANAIAWCALLGVWLGLMAGWPQRRRPRPRPRGGGPVGRGLVGGAAAGLTLAELHRLEHHGGDDDHHGHGGGRLDGPVLLDAHHHSHGGHHGYGDHGRGDHGDGWDGHDGHGDHSGSDGHDGHGDHGGWDDHGDHGGGWDDHDDW